MSPAAMPGSTPMGHPPPHIRDPQTCFITGPSGAFPDISFLIPSHKLLLSQSVYACVPRPFEGRQTAILPCGLGSAGDPCWPPEEAV